MLGVEDLADTATLTVGDYLGTWLGHVKGRVRGTTYDGYEALVRRHAVPGLGSIPLRSLHPLQVQGLYSQMLSPGYRGQARCPSAKTVANLHRVLRQAMGQALRWRLVEWNPAAAAEPPRARRAELTVIDQALASRILGAAAGTRFELPVAVAMATGMRRGEILGLRWGDLDPDYTVARVSRSLQVSATGLAFEEPKTARSRRAVALPQFLRPYLERHREDQARRRAEEGQAWSEGGLIVDAGEGRPWNPDRFSAAWPEFLVRVGLPHVRFHDLRHAHATFMLMQGVHPKVVSERLGHASIGITLDTYSHVLPTMQEQAARAFDDLFSPPSEAHHDEGAPPRRARLPE
jgi:integrase